MASSASRAEACATQPASRQTAAIEPGDGQRPSSGRHCGGPRGARSRRAARGHPRNAAAAGRAWGPAVPRVWGRPSRTVTRRRRLPRSRGRRRQRGLPCRSLGLLSGCTPSVPERKVTARRRISSSRGAVFHPVGVGEERSRQVASRDFPRMRALLETNALPDMRGGIRSASAERLLLETTPRFYQKLPSDRTRISRLLG